MDTVHYDKVSDGTIYYIVANSHEPNRFVAVSRGLTKIYFWAMVPLITGRCLS